MVATLRLFLVISAFFIPLRLIPNTKPAHPLSYMVICLDNRWSNWWIKPQANRFWTAKWTAGKDLG